MDDPRDVDPRIGTLDQFDDLVSALHAAGIRIIVDIVPNHTSDRHHWFREALASPPGSRARDRYIFRDGLGEDGSTAPADWTSQFGGPAWSRVEDGQWYLHTHSREQPDLNWDHPDVRADFLHTLEFWADRGVDGFRVDVAHLLVKDLPGELPEEAELNRPGAYPDGRHPTKDRDEVHEIYATWRELFNRYDPPRMAVAQAWVPAHRRVRYASPEGLGQAFNFDLLRAAWDAGEYRRIIGENLDLVAQTDGSSTWVLSNHDVVRHATRYGLGCHTRGKEWLASGGTSPVEDRALGLNRARAGTLLALALPGSAYLYQGEELGLPEVAEIPDEQRQDPRFQRSDGAEKGRDGCRVPLPWSHEGPAFGFSTAEPHLPQPTWFADYVAADQDVDPYSTLTLYREAIRVRGRFLNSASATAGRPEITWLDAGADVVAFRRSDGWVCLTNMGTSPVEGPASILLSSDPVLDYAGVVPPDTTVWASA